MSLVRIVSESKDGSFNQTFKEDVFFPPNSKIALNTFSMNNALKGYRLDGSNNRVEVILSTDSDLYSFDVFLKKGNVQTQQDLSDVLDDWFRQLNSDDYIHKSGLNVGNPFSNNVSWFLDRGLTDNLNSFYSNHRAGIYEDLQDLSLVEKITIGGTNFFQTTNTSNTALFNQKIEYIHHLNTAKGRFYIQPAILEDSGEGNQTAAAGTNGILIGLVEDDYDNTLTKIKYGCYINNLNSTYRTINNGVETNTAQPVSQIDYTDIENNDFMSIEKVGTNYLIKKYSPIAGLTATLATLPIPESEMNTQLFPVVIFKGKGDPAGNGAKAKIIAYTPADINNPPLYHSEIRKLELSNNQDSSPILTNDPRDVERSEEEVEFVFKFDKLETAKIFGFTETLNESEFDSDIGTHLFSPNLLRPFVKNEYFVIVIDNLKLTAYDGESQSRQNVLSYIPKADDLNGVVQYEPNNLYYMSLNNKEGIKLRNIRGRILDSELLGIFTEGLTTFSFLIN